MLSADRYICSICCGKHRCGRGGGVVGGPEVPTGDIPTNNPAALCTQLW